MHPKRMVAYQSADGAVPELTALPGCTTSCLKIESADRLSGSTPSHGFVTLPTLECYEVSELGDSCDQSTCGDRLRTVARLHAGDATCGNGCHPLTSVNSAGLNIDGLEGR